jgi:hypothetical protein
MFVIILYTIKDGIKSKELGGYFAREHGLENPFTHNMMNMLQ